MVRSRISACRRGWRSAALGALLSTVLVLVPGVGVPAGAAVNATATPATNLVDGQTVTVEVSGAPAGATLYVGECTDAAFTSCDVSTPNISITADPTGHGSAAMPVSATVRRAAGDLDCRVTPSCRLLVVGPDPTGSYGLVASIDLAFDPLAPLAPPPTLTGTPSTGLADHQPIAVHGTGYLPNQPFNLRECTAGTATPSTCLQSGYTSGFTSAAGTIDTTFTVAAAGLLNGYVPVDCTHTACELVVFGARMGSQQAHVPLTFEPSVVVPPPPTLAISPATALVDHQVVAVAGGGYPAGSPIGLLECTTRSCIQVGHATADAAGGISTTVGLRAALYDRGLATVADCRPTPGACRLVAAAYDGSERVGDLALDFDPVAALAPPPTLTVAPATGLRDGQVVRVSGTGYVSDPTGPIIVPAVVSPGGSPRPDPTALRAAHETRADTPRDAVGFATNAQICATSDVTGASCTPAASAATIDEAGVLSGTVQLRAVTSPAGQPVDCRTQACELRVGEVDNPLGRGVAPLAFDPAAPLAPPPTITISPATALHDGQSVHVHASGLPSMQYATVLQCAGDPTAGLDPRHCRYVGAIAADVVGDADTDLIAERTFEASAGGPGSPASFDCVTVAGGCFLAVQVNVTQQVVSAPITFDPTVTGTRYVDRVFPQVDITRDIVYGRAIGEAGMPQDLHLDLYEPHGDTLAERPVMLYIHGGYFSGGDKSEGAQVGRELAKRGYVVLSIEYRLYPGGNEVERYAKAIPAALHDAQAAVRWARANTTTHHLSPSAIGTMGYSAGGFTSFHLGFLPDEPAESGNPGFSNHVAAVVSLAGGSVQVTAGAPPMIAFSSTDDSVVPYAWVKQTCDDAVALGERCTLTTYHGVDHGIYAKYTDFMPKVLAFLAATLVPALSPPTVPPPDPVPPAIAPPPPGAASPVTARPAFTG